MQIGYSVTSYQADTTPEEAVGTILDRAAVAKQAEFDYIQVGDHHVVAAGVYHDEDYDADAPRGSLYLQNVPTAARLTDQFDRVAVMFLLPLYNPILVAEQMGTIDAFADHCDFWCAVGFGEHQFQAFDVPIEERAPRFEEAIRLLRLLWTQEDVSFDGEFYSVEEVSVNPKADARICIGGTAEPAVKRAGRMGDAWVANADVAGEALKERIDWFEESGGGDVIVRRDVLALSDAAKAQALARETLEQGYRGWSVDADWVWAGDHHDIIERMDSLRSLGVDEVVFRPMKGGYATETLQTVAEARQGLE